MIYMRSELEKIRSIWPDLIIKLSSWFQNSQPKKIGIKASLLLLFSCQHCQNPQKVPYDFLAQSLIRFLSLPILAQEAQTHQKLMSCPCCVRHVLDTPKYTRSRQRRCRIPVVSETCLVVPVSCYIDSCYIFVKLLLGRIAITFYSLPKLLLFFVISEFNLLLSIYLIS